MSTSSVGSISVMIPITVTLPFPQNDSKPSADTGSAVTAVSASAGLAPTTAASSAGGASSSNQDDGRHKGEHAGHHKPSSVQSTASNPTLAAMAQLHLGGL